MLHQDPNKEPTVLRWQWAPSQLTTFGLGMRCSPRQATETEIAQLRMPSVGHAFSERLPQYPSTAYDQKTCTHSIHILNFTAQELIRLNFELKWVEDVLAFVWHR